MTLCFSLFIENLLLLLSFILKFCKLSLKLILASTLATCELTFPGRHATALEGRQFKIQVLVRENLTKPGLKMSKVRDLVENNIHY